MKFTKITNSSQSGTLKPYWDGWLQERFPGHFAQISTVNTLRLKNSVRDVARFLLGSVPFDIEMICKELPVPPQGISDEKFLFGYNSDEGHIPGQVEVNLTLQKYINQYPDHWEIVKKCLSLWRSKGRHAAGYVISNEPIDEFIPTTQVSGVKVLDFTGPECENVGAIKYDFLVVNSVNDVQRCLELIHARHMGGIPQDQKINELLVPGLRIVPGKDGLVHDIWDLPQDPEVFRDIDEGKVETVFQLDSNAARQGLRNFKGIINSISDMAVFTALDRPGPLDYMVTNPDNPSEKINMLVEYSRRAKGLAGSPDVAKELDTLCAETKGIMIYQESVMRVYQHFTGCTLAEAEEFRGNVGKKKKDKIEAAYKLFMERSVGKVTEDVSQRVWDSIITFSKYGFNKSHAKSYVTLSYACLWLKHYYPLEWWCGVLSSATKEEINDKFWQHCGHLVLLPEIVKSKSTWEIEGTKIRAPIGMLSGMGEQAQAQLSKGLPYTDLRSFCTAIVKHQKDNMEVKDKIVKGEPKKVQVWGRNALNVSMITNMIITGCLDSFFEPDTSEAAKLDAYHAMMKELYAAEGKKYAQSKKKMPQLDAFGRYQAKKKVLPPYGENLAPLLVAIGQIPEYLQVDGKHIRMKGDTVDRYNRPEDRWDPVIDGERLSDWECDVGEKWLRCGILAYVEEKEVISGKNKQRLQITFDVGGKKIQAVCWPDDDNKFPLFTEKASKGAIVAAIVLKGPKGYSVKDIKVIREPLGVDNKEDEE